MYDKPKEWSKQEEDSLILNYPRMTSAELVKLFNRPKNSIIGKAFRLGLKKAPKPSKVFIPSDYVEEPTPEGTFKYEDLKPNQCQFPYGSDIKRFCGKQKTKGVYCEEHYRKCYRSVKSH